MIEKKAKKDNKKYIIMSIVFMVLIACPFILYIFLKPVADKIDYGKRNATYTYFYENQYVDTAAGVPDSLAYFPEISTESIRTFPTAFENWYNDRIPFKKLLIKLNSEINYNLFHQFINSHVVAGKEGWLFYDEAVDASIGKWTLSQEELEKIAFDLQFTSDVLKSQGKKFVLFICPNKETLYSEYLPDYDYVRVDKTPVNQLIDYLNENTTIKVVYPKEELETAINEHPDVDFYHRLDTHWNCAGAYIGAKVLSEALGKELPDFSDVKYDEYDFNASDLTSLAGMPVNSGTKDYSIYAYGEETTILDQWEYYDLIRYHNDEEEGNIIVFRDSFSTALSQHLSTVFNKSIYPLGDTDKQQIYEYDADIVVYEIVERDIRNLMGMGL